MRRIICYGMIMILLGFVACTKNENKIPEEKDMNKQDLVKEIPIEVESNGSQIETAIDKVDEIKKIDIPNDILTVIENRNIKCLIPVDDATVFIAAYQEDELLSLYYYNCESKQTESMLHTKLPYQLKCGATNYGAYIYDRDGFCYIYDRGLNQMNHIEVASLIGEGMMLTEGEFSLSYDYKKMAYIKTVFEGDYTYYDVHIATLDLKEDDVIYRVARESTKAFELCGIDSIQLSPDGSRLFFNGITYPKEGDSVLSRECTGFFNLGEGGDLEQIDLGSYVYVPFQSGILVHDVLNAGNQYSGHVFINNMDKQSPKTYLLKKKEESQSVCVSPKGKYFVTVVSDTVEGKFAVKLSVYNAKTGKRIAHYDKEYGDNVYIDNYSILEKGKKILATVWETDKEVQYVSEIDF